MKLFAYYDPKFESLKENFVDTCQDDYEMHFVDMDYIPPHYSKEKLDQAYWIVKPKLVKQWVGENLGDIIIISDVDIQFFGKTRPIVDAIAPHFDLVGQHMPCPYNLHCGLNIGFMSLKCTPKMVDFWAEVENLVESTHQQDEIIVSQIIDKLSWTMWDEKLFWCHDGNEPPQELILHHATHTKNWEEKVQQMIDMKEKLVR